MASIARATGGTKLLGRCEHDEAGHPFVLVNWLARGGTTAVLSSGSLKYTNAANSVHPLMWELVSARSKTMVYGVFNAPVACHAGPCLHVTDPTSPWEMVWGRACLFTSSASFLFEYENEAEVGSSTGTPAAKSAGTDYGLTLFGDGGGVAVFRDHTGALTLTRDLTNLTSGKLGINVFWANDVLVRRIFACTDRYVTVTGVLSGLTVEVRKADDTVLASATSAAGTASVDMISVALELAKKIVVKAGAVELVTFTAAAGEIIEPGETYAATGISLRVGSSRPGSAGHRRLRARR